ncbi:MAG: hypothetical protein KU37_02505 [Sulfuricurvum sp. PC08-66]|nr:MAG: hypothetical protein KU37_02505 [Sulfuricurvum sp. PC08-66]
MTKEEILTFLAQHKKSFERKYHVSQMAIFGSFARGEQHEKSDVDIIYTLSEGSKLSFDGYIELENELNNAFGTKVDLVNAKKFNPLVMLEASKDLIYV